MSHETTSESDRTTNTGGDRATNARCPHVRAGAAIYAVCCERCAPTETVWTREKDGGVARLADFQPTTGGVRTIDVRPSNSAYMRMLREIASHSGLVSDRIWAREELARWEAAVDAVTLFTPDERGAVGL